MNYKSTVWLNSIIFLILSQLFHFLVQPLNPAWPQTLLFHSAFSDRLKDLSVKNWSQLAGSGPVPWRQAPSMFNSSLPSGERPPYEVDISAALNKLNTSERLPVSIEKRKNDDFSERFLNGSLMQCGQDICENGTAGVYLLSLFFFSRLSML